MEPDFQNKDQDIPSDTKIANPSNKMKLMIPVLALILIIIAGVGGYYLSTKKTNSQTASNNANKSPTLFPSPPQGSTPTPINNKIADWKTYQNEDYGYTINYPSGWTTERADQGANVINQKYRYYLILTKTDPSGQNGDYWISLEVSTPSALTEDYINSASSATKTTVLGLNANKLEFRSTPQSPSRTEYYFERNSSEYKISILYRGASDKMGDQIISTIKFIK